MYMFVLTWPRQLSPAVVLTWPDLRGSREMHGQREGEGLGSHLCKRAVMYTEHMPQVHSCPWSLYTWFLVSEWTQKRLTGLDRLRNRDEKRKMLELIHRRFLRRNEHVCVCVKETEGETGGEEGGGISRQSCLPWVPVLGFAFFCSTVLINTHTHVWSTFQRMTNSGFNAWNMYSTPCTSGSVHVRR